MNRPHAAAIIAAFAAALAQPAIAQQAFPSKPVRIIVGLAPGGGTDIQARMYAQKLGEETKQSFVVENRPGAGEGIAIQAIRSSAPDGHTILAVTPSITIAPAFSDPPAFDPVKDFAHISLVSTASYLMVVNPKVPARTFQEFVNYAKANKGKVNFGSGGLGTTIHLGGLWISNVTGTDITVIPYKGTGPSLVALLAGDTHATFGNPLSTLPHVKSGKLRAIAVTSVKRARAFPDIPTIAESGIPGYDVTTWHGWIVNKDTPRNLVNQINAAVVKMITSPEMTAKVLADGAEPVGSTPEQFVQLIAAETPRWRKLVKDTGATLQ